MLIKQLLDLGRGDIGAVFDEALDRAEFLDQLDGGLFADAANARDVVRDVAHQPLEIDRLDGLEAVALADPIGRVENRLRHAPLTRQHKDVLIDEL